MGKSLRRPGYLNSIFPNLEKNKNFVAEKPNKHCLNQAIKVNVTGNNKHILMGCIPQYDTLRRALSICDILAKNCVTSN